MANMTRMMEMKMRDGRERGAATESLYIKKRIRQNARDAAIEVSNKEIERVITGIKGSELDEGALKQTREELEQLITGKYSTLNTYNYQIAEIMQEIEKIEMELSLSGKPRTYSVESIR